MTFKKFLQVTYVSILGTFSLYILFATVFYNYYNRWMTPFSLEIPFRSCELRRTPFGDTIKTDSCWLDPQKIFIVFAMFVGVWVINYFILGREKKK